MTSLRPNYVNSLQRSRAFRRLLAALVIIGSAALIALIVSLLSHAQYHHTLDALRVLIVLALALLVVASFERIRALAFRMAAVFALSAFLLPFTSRVAFRLDLWQLQRLVASEVLPTLEAFRRANGHYPADLAEAGFSEVSGPRVLSLLSLRSSSDRYVLFISDPSACGHGFSYSSRNRVWVTEHVECWF